MSPSPEKAVTVVEWTVDEKALLIARLARGKSKLPWRAAEEELAIDKLMALLDAFETADEGGHS